MWKADPSAGLLRCGAYEVPGESIRQVVLADGGRVAFLAVGPSRLQAVRWNHDGTATKCLDEQHTGLFYRLPISPVAADDRTILCQWHVSGLYAYEAVDGTARFTGFHYPHGMATHGGCVADGTKWLVATRGGYVEVAAGDTRSPEIGLVRIKGEDLSGKPMLYGRTLFVAHPFTGAVRAVDLADVRRPRLLGKLQLAEHPGLIRLLNDTALVPAGYQGLVAWNYRRESE